MHKVQLPSVPIGARVISPSAGGSAAHRQRAAGRGAVPRQRATGRVRGDECGARDGGTGLPRRAFGVSWANRRKEGEHAREIGYWASGGERGKGKKRTRERKFIHNRRYMHDVKQRRLAGHDVKFYPGRKRKDRWARTVE